MKVCVYNSRTDEKEYLEQFGKQFRLELKMTEASPTIETCYLAEGCEALSIITETNITAEMMHVYRELGIRFISTRTIGFEHMDQAAAVREGITLANVHYSPSSVADYAIMMILMVLRKAKSIMYRHLGQDYTMAGHRGRELSHMSVGIVGTGKIGATVAKHLTGFGCRIYAFDLYPNQELSNIVEYVDLHTLYQKADIITLHVPSTPENRQMINRESLEEMREGAVIINTARGDLIDTEALIDALESGKLYGAGLDLVDGDQLIYYRDQKYQTVKNRQMAVLNAMPNVLMLPHMAFYTDHAVSDMVEHSLESCRMFAEGKTKYPENPWILH